MLPKFKKILYASDVGPGSRPAFRRAVSLASQYEAELHFLHVLSEIPESAQHMMQNYFSDDELAKMEKSGLERMAANVHERIVRFCESELEEIEAMDPEEVKIRVQSGTPWKVILEVADKIEADVIVMGVRHHSRVETFLLGSTSNKVMVHSHRPVLIVPLTDKN